MDAIDILLTLGIFACFVIFAVCLWLIRRQVQKPKSEQDTTPPKVPKG